MKGSPTHGPLQAARRLARTLTGRAEIEQLRRELNLKTEELRRAQETSRRAEELIAALSPSLAQAGATDHGEQFGILLFRCNICGNPSTQNWLHLTREEPSCGHCQSTLRQRSMIYMLSMELFGTSLAIDDFPLSKHIAGLGLSDWDVYAEKLATKFDYTNTFLDQDPRLDIRIPDDSLDGTVDFMIASDVFEHVPPPVSPCFKNARRMLKDHGVLIFSVPYTAGDGITKEHYPALYDFEIEDRDGTRVLVNRTKAGAVEEFEDPVFHGGSGLTLEMRVFTESSLLEEFRRAAFEPVKVHRGPDFGHGIYWGVDWSLPMAARAGPMGARSWSGRGAGASRRRLGSPALKAAQRGAASSARVATFGAHSSLPATNE